MRYLSDVVTLEFDVEKCTGCSVCLEVCPHGIFRLAGRRAHIINKDICMECGACVNNCAFGALAVERGVGCAAAVINSMITGGEPSCGCSGDEAEKGGCC